ncbi:sensor histidine kinase [Thermomonospora umbrina]|nr:histidine kinase [Thermomonospora umbrina]
MEGGFGGRTTASEELCRLCCGLLLGLLAGTVAARVVRSRRDRRCGGCVAVQQERRRIAQELHDVIGHGLVVIAMHSRRLPPVAPQALPLAALIDDTAQATLRDLRRVVGVLRGTEGAAAPAPAPNECSLRARLADVVGRLPGAQAVTVRVTGKEGPLPAGTEDMALQIVQESLTNALKYGGGPLTVEIGYRRDRLTVTVTNRPPRALAEAPPRLPAPFSGGQGLTGLRERVTAQGGTFLSGPRSDGGFVVHARLPLVGTPRHPRTGVGQSRETA